MTSQTDSADEATCLKLISLGYARSNRVRLYGQELQLVSDPFSKEGEIMVEVKGHDNVLRTMRLPISVVQVAANNKKIA